MSLWEFANPVKFMALSGKVLPWVIGLCAVTLIPGMIWGFFFTPEAANFGNSVKIIYIHVPSAMMAINIWVMMLVTSLIWIVRRHHVSVRAAKAAALIGVTMTVIALITGLWLGWYWDFAPWVWFKLGLVALLAAHYVMTGFMVARARRGEFRESDFYLRVFNEISVFGVIAVLWVVVVKPF